MRGGDVTTNRLTNGIALPAASPLAKAGAVHHVTLIVSLAEQLVHIIGQAINNALVWMGKRNSKLHHWPS